MLPDEAEAEENAQKEMNATIVNAGKSQGICVQFGKS
jgi:hypothetical protein